MVKVAIHYEEAEDIQRRLAKFATQVDDMTHRLRNQQAVLEDGGWKGRGSDAFQREMNELRSRSLDGLTRALEESSKAFRVAIDMFKDAEQRGQNLFKGGVGVELRGADRMGFFLQLIPGLLDMFPKQLASLGKKILNLGKSAFPKLFSGGKATALLGKLGNFVRKVPFLSTAVGVYDFSQLPAEQKTWKNFAIQVGSGITQDLISLTPIKWIDFTTQVIGGGIQIGGELLGAPPEFIDTVRDITDAVSFDKILDKTISVVIEDPLITLGPIGGNAIAGVNQWMNLPEDQRTIKNLTVQTISSLLQPNTSAFVGVSEYIAEYHAKLNNQDPQAAIANARREALSTAQSMNTLTDSIVSGGVQLVDNLFSGAMQRMGL